MNAHLGRLAVVLFAVQLLCVPVHAQLNEWAWMGGTNRVNAPVSYGPQGSFSQSNTPGARAGMQSWMDKAGNLWAFGGYGYLTGGFSDMWELNTSTLQWAWVAGPQGEKHPPVYGTLGASSPNSYPGARVAAATWADRNGNFWLFGGKGNDPAGNVVYLNDLWKFDPAAELWTWMGGSDVAPNCPSTNSCGYPGVYGTLGVSSPGNIPGGRSDAMTWTDSNGDFWLFGGRLYIVYLNGWGGYENDLWKYSPTYNEWTWMGGDSSLPSTCTLNSSCGRPGVYGTLQVPSTTNHPGSRQDAAAWTDSHGNFWMMGGFAYDSTGVRGYLNDLWEYNPTTGAWTWMSGSNSLPTVYAGAPGIYGTKGVPAAGNVPPGRSFAMGWTDNMGKLWLFSGSGFDPSINWNYYSDTWAFDPSSNQWTWMNGSSLSNQPAFYGSLGVASPLSDPGSRSDAAAESDSAGNFWMFGGSNINGYLSDIWKYQTSIVSVKQASSPTFSPGAGTYSSAQTVMISDTTPGATIYYTTDGSTPTLASAKYSAPILVGTTETIKAMAAAPGYSESAIASVAYVINLPAAGFSLNASPSAVTVSHGGQSSATVTVTPLNGFNSAVSLACSGLPLGVTCSFTPAAVTPSGGAANSVVVFAETPVASVSTFPFNRFAPMSAIAFASIVLLFRPQRVRTWILLLLALVPLTLWTGCTASVLLMGAGSGNSQSVTKTITITATAGQLQQTAPIILTMK